MNTTACVCTCSCSPNWTGTQCEQPKPSGNQHFSGRIIIPMDKQRDTSWKHVQDCIDRTWNDVNQLLSN